MKDFSCYQVNFDGVEFGEGYGIYKKDRFENYETAKRKIEEAWEERKKAVTENGYKVIYEFKRDDKDLDYHHQIVLAYRNRHAVLVDLWVQKKHIIIR